MISQKNSYLVEIITSANVWCSVSEHTTSVPGIIRPDLFEAQENTTEFALPIPEEENEPRHDEPIPQERAELEERHEIQITAQEICSTQVPRSASTQDTASQHSWLNFSHNTDKSDQKITQFLTSVSLQEPIRSPGPQPIILVQQNENYLTPNMLIDLPAQARQDDSQNARIDQPANFEQDDGQSADDFIDLEQNSQADNQNEGDSPRPDRRSPLLRRGSFDG